MDEDVMVGAAAVTYIAITYATNILKKEERKRQKAFWVFDSTVKLLFHC